ncbi:DUF2244 domain-containing protein [Roseibium sp. RKSG952]|uniref:DUF2244 domain-containing protein n=1 Tax=Roseibium sp. RKSG952 TaxID=2529384 RepID=UPI0012BBB7BE|nr:DUF2244 domain-containing protein [Roseibium sp. RKSG952]MTI01112.1 DUF2244 domain-containing protein [Roseibium sp. RKSG952]
MSEDNPKRDPASDGFDADRPFFSAVLTPHRSLGPNGFLILMLCMGLISFVAGMLFLMIGAWPVFGFFGLDMVLIYLAFRWNYASAKAYEEVSVSATEIIIRKIGPRKRRQEFRFNPVWVRLSVTRLEDEGVTRISLFSRGERVDIGDFLNPDDRTSFASAMANALSIARSGGVRLG